MQKMPAVSHVQSQLNSQEGNSFSVWWAHTQHSERVQLRSFMANVGAEELKVSPSLLMYSGVCF